MATKLTVPRPAPRTDAAAKVRAEKNVESLDAADLVEDADVTEPSPAPPMAETETEAEIVAVMIPPPAPVALAHLAREPMRSVATSVLSEFERDSIRKSSPPVALRRKELQKLVASAVGVAWFICLIAIGQSALHAILASVGSR